MDTLPPQLGFDLVTSEQDIQFEHHIAESPDLLNSWLHYLRHKQQQHQQLQSPAARHANVLHQLFILQRATAHLNKSYKLWTLYLDIRVTLVQHLHPLKFQKHFRAVNKLFQCCLTSLSKYPGIWQRYLNFLIQYQPQELTFIRREFSHCFQALPLTQHGMIWDMYIDFTTKLTDWFSTSNDHIAVILSNIYLKYLQYYPTQLENVLEKLTDLGNYSDAIKLYESRILNNPKFTSSMGKSSLEVYLEYAELIINHVKEIIEEEEEDGDNQDNNNTQQNQNQTQQNLLKYDQKLETFLTNLIKLFPDQLGKVVVRLSGYFIIRNNRVKADDIFSCYLQRCLTIKDFKLIYDAYLEFQENNIKEYLEQIDTKESKVAFLKTTSEEKASNAKQMDNLNALLDIAMQKFENLIKHRKHYIYDILLRQDINNCAIWLKKTKLYDEDTELSEKLGCFVEAIKQIKPSKAHYDNFYNDDDDDDNDNDNSNNNSKEQDDDEKMTEDVVKKLEDKEAAKINDKLRKTSGLEEIWISYAKVYQLNSDIDTARSIYQSAIKVPFTNANDLVEIYIAWADMELDNETTEDGSVTESDADGFEKAVKIIENAILVKPDFKVLGIAEDQISFFNEDLKAQLKIHKSIKLWSFYLDLIESTGDFDRTVQAYEKILRLKILNPVILINYVNFLQDNQHFEKSFQVFEIGLEKFDYYPIKNEIYSLYLTKLLKRYQDLSISFSSSSSTNPPSKSTLFQFKERLRDVFEQSVNGCPSNLCKPLYLQYASFEAQYGTKGKALQVYQQCIYHLHFDPNDPAPSLQDLSGAAISLSATTTQQQQSQQQLDKVAPNDEDIVEVYQLYISAQTSYEGPAATRQIYQHILNNEPQLPNYHILQFVLQFATLELQLKEVDRARAILIYGATSLAGAMYKVRHPKYKQQNLQKVEEFWAKWDEFELKWGNEETYKEMLRTKRNVLQRAS